MAKVKTEAAQIDSETMANLRIFISSRNKGRTYGLIGPALKEAIVLYIEKNGGDIYPGCE